MNNIQKICKEIAKLSDQDRKYFNEYFNLNKLRKHIYRATARRLDGSVKWFAERCNIVPTIGLTDNLDVHLLNGSQSAIWYLVPITGTMTILPADTMASKAWTEFTNYDEVTREVWSGVRTSLVATNAASKGTITSSGDAQVIKGLALANSATKGETASVLFSVAAFNLGDKSLDTGETLDLEYEITIADDGV